MKRRKAGKVVLKVTENADENFENENVDPPALRIPLVLRCIFRNLSVPDLLENCSLVCKIWNYESRSFLRDKQIFTFCTKSVNRPEDTKFVLNMSQSNVIIFTRLEIGPVTKNSRKDEKLDKAICKLVDAIKLRILHIEPHEFGQRLYNEHGGHLDAKIIAHALRSKCDTIQELSFGRLMPPGKNPSDEEYSLKTLIQELESQESFRLSALNNLRFWRKKKFYHRDQEIWAGMMSTIVLPIISMSPQLKNVNLAVPFRPFYIPSFSERSAAKSIFPAEYSHLFKRFQLKTYVRDQWEGLLRNEKLECKCLELDLIKLYKHMDTGLQLLGPFLNRNRESLTVFITNFSTLLNLRKGALLNICMPNMKHVCVQMEKKRRSITEWKGIFRIVSNFPFIFPNLESFALEDDWPRPWRFPAIEEITGEPFTVPDNNDANISWGLKRLIIRDCFDLKGTEILATMFPHVQHLSACGYNIDDGLEYIWKCWPFLRSVEIVQERLIEIDFNATMCGFYRSAACELQEKTADQLSEMVIVPSRPSIAVMKNLESLRILLVNKQMTGKRWKCDVPKVFQAFVAQHMKGLTVEFEHIPYALRLGAEEELLF